MRGWREAPILAAIEGWLAWQPDIIVWRQNAGQLKTVNLKTGRRHTVRLAPAGSADLTGVIWPGVRLEVEAKSAKGRQSPAQAAFQVKLEALGGLYVLARSVEDVSRAVERFRHDNPSPNRPTRKPY